MKRTAMLVGIAAMGVVVFAVASRSGSDRVSRAQTESSPADDEIPPTDRKSGFADEPAQRDDESAALDSLARAVADRDYDSIRLAVAALSSDQATRAAAVSSVTKALEDPQFVFDFRLQKQFERYLQGSPVLPALGSAASLRLSWLATGKGQVRPAECGFLTRILADHASTDELQSFMDTPMAFSGHNNRGIAFAESQRSEVQAMVVRQFEAGRLPPATAVEFGRHNPDMAYGLFANAIGDRDVSASGYSIKSLADALAASVSPDKLDEAKALLLSHARDDDGYELTYGVQRLRDRGYDISGCEPIVAAPADAIERVAQASDASSRAGELYAAMYAIEYNRIAWTPRARLVLTRAAELVRQFQGSLSADMVKLAARIEQQ